LLAVGISRRLAADTTNGSATGFTAFQMEACCRIHSFINCDVNRRFIYKPTRVDQLTSTHNIQEARCISKISAIFFATIKLKTDGNNLIARITKFEKI
jgi:hypothetical protein